MNSNEEQNGRPDKNFGLNAEEFHIYLKKLLHGDETLFEIIFRSHFDVCRSYLVRKMGADPDVAYDITLDVLVRFRRNLLSGKIRYGNLSALFTIDARNAYLRWSDKAKKQEYLSTTDEDTAVDDSNNDAELEMEKVTNLKNALSKTGSDCYELLNWHYYLKMPMKKIAETRAERGDGKFINEDAVKTKISECRKKLRQLMGIS
jgi:DNA-directed RNA polymerase specialized sigma24 family protein